MREDWVEVVLGEVCKINMGQSPPSSTYNTDKIGLPFFQGKAEFTELHPIVEKWCSEPTKIAEPNDILLSVRAPVGATNVANQKCAIGRGLAAISYTYDYKYILFFLRLIEKKLDSQGTGTTFRAISGTVLKSQIIPLAPLPIQRAIVRKIENLFASLDKGIADLKTAQEQLKVYRQAVLKKAFEGRFGSAQRPSNNLKDGELPEGWKWVKIKEVAEINPKLPNKENIDLETEVQFLPMKLVEEEINKIHLTETKLLHEVQKGSYTPFIENDIVFAKVTPCMENGKVAVTKKLKNNIGYGSSEFHVIRCKEDVLNSYLFYFVVQSKFRKEAEHEMTGAVGLRRVPRRFIEEFLIPLPPTLSEQHAIVREIESRLSVCDKVEQEIALAIERSRNLRQSILKKAFEGRLLSEAEVTKCKQEADYEPASVLLERIERSRNERIKKEKHGK